MDLLVGDVRRGADVGDTSPLSPMLSPLLDEARCRSLAQHLAHRERGEPGVIATRIADLLVGCRPLQQLRALSPEEQGLFLRALAGTSVRPTEAEKEEGTQAGGKSTRPRPSSAWMNPGSALHTEQPSISDPPVMRFTLYRAGQPGRRISCGGLVLPEKLAIQDVWNLAVKQEGRGWLPLQVAPLSRWGGVPLENQAAPLRWIHLCVQHLDSENRENGPLALELYQRGPAPEPVQAVHSTFLDSRGIELVNGTWRVRFLPPSSPSAAFPLELSAQRLAQLQLHPEIPGAPPSGSSIIHWQSDSVRLLEAGPLETRLRLEGTQSIAARMPTAPGAGTLVHIVELSIRAGEPLLHLSHTILNPQRAHHPGNTWPVQDEGTVPFPPLSWALTNLPDVQRVETSVDGRLVELPHPFRLFQGWPLRQAPPSARIAGRSPQDLPLGLWLGKPGQSDLGRRVGLAADTSPVVYMGAQNQRWEASLDADDIWTRGPAEAVLGSQNPQQDAASPDERSRHSGWALALSRAPEGSGEVLQGGEQATFRLTARLVEQGPAAVARRAGNVGSREPRAANVGEAAEAKAEPDRVASALQSAHAVDFFLPSPPDFLLAQGAFRADAPLSEGDLSGLDRTALSALGPQGRSPRALPTLAGRHGAVGWREFGEVQADHETRCGVSTLDDPSFVSNYNNQYDLVGSAWHFCGRSSDSAWCALATQLGRHTSDIDVYHTREDRPVWNGGLFWHTTHDTPAGDGTHRGWPSLVYSKGCTSWQSGGPGLGHLYVEGLVLGWLMLNDSVQRDAALRQVEMALNRWTLDPSERDGRAVANTLRSLLTLCEISGLDLLCDAADRIVLRLPLQAPGLSQSERWMESMQAEALFRWREHVQIRARIRAHSILPVDAIQRIDSWLVSLCSVLRAEATSVPLDVHRLRYADVLTMCLRLPSSDADTRAALWQTVMSLNESLETGYWASGTYPNAKELALLLSSGHRFRAERARTRRIPLP